MFRHSEQHDLHVARFQVRIDERDRQTLRVSTSSSSRGSRTRQVNEDKRENRNEEQCRAARGIRTLGRSRARNSEQLSRVYATRCNAGRDETTGDCWSRRTGRPSAPCARSRVYSASLDDPRLSPPLGGGASSVSVTSHN